MRPPSAALLTPTCHGPDTIADTAFHLESTAAELNRQEFPFRDDERVRLAMQVT
jgi:hypothetical protein